MNAWRARAHTVQDFAAVRVDAILVQDTQEQDTITATITANYLDLLGVRPVVGRAFTAAEERPGAASVAMITYGLWQRRYGGRAASPGWRPCAVTSAG